MINTDKYFTDLFRHTGNLVYFLTVDGIIELVNPAWLATLGYTTQEVIGHSIYDFVHPHYRAAYKATRESAIANNTIEQLELVFITRNNKLVTGDGEIGCFYQDGVPMHTRCIFKDITPKKEIETQIKESEKRLKSFFTSAPDAVVVINEFQQIIEWNMKAEAIFGFTAQEVLGKTLTETIMPVQYREAHIKGMQHFFKTGAGPVLNKIIEVTALHKNGAEFHISLSISNIKHEDKWIFIAFMADISERKKTEEALIKKEAELLQSKILDEKKDEFIAMASHEFKTPLTTIKTYAQLASLTWKQKPEEVVNYLSKINQFADKLTFLINELLDVSKIQSGKFEFIKTEVSMNIFLADVINSIQLITLTHKIIIEQNDEVNYPVDTLRMEQVLINLISNAVKYSPGKDIVTVRSYVKDNSLIIAVTDYGIGIEKQNINKIFGRFYRIESQAENITGLGIGLYISLEIIKNHGGTIQVDSVVGKGTTFLIILPIDTMHYHHGKINGLYNNTA